jgi:DNA invertase Pin-like site-specific DNA recombinase
MRVAICTRVSTGSRTTENQLRELQAVAERSDWEVVARFTDEGISGAKGNAPRPNPHGPLLAGFLFSTP